MTDCSMAQFATSELILELKSRGLLVQTASESDVFTAMMNNGLRAVTPRAAKEYAAEMLSGDLVTQVNAATLRAVDAVVVQFFNRF